MERIYFQHKKPARKAPAVIISIAILFTVAIFAFASRDNVESITGLAVYGKEKYLNEEPAASVKAFIAEENTGDGLILKYGEMKQGVVEIGIPVKWSQEIKVENLNDFSVANSVVSLFAPKDAKNVRIMIGEKQLSSSATALLPEIKPKAAETITLSFETSPVWIEFIDENENTRVRIWQNSSMKYRNVEIQMDIKLGEKIVELVGDSEEDIEFDYDSGKAKWVIEEI